MGLEITVREITLFDDVLRCSDFPDVFPQQTGMVQLI
jgi:hypothetical protein